MNQLLELRQKRAKVLTDVHALVTATGARALNVDELATFDRMMAEEKQLRDTIERLESADALIRDSNTRDDSAANGGSRQDQSPVALYRNAYRSYLHHGFDRMPEEHRSILTSANPEFRALSATTTTAGGFTVPQDFGDSIVTALKAYGGIEQAGARIMPTDGGNPLPWPRSTDVANVGELLAENTAAAEQDVAFTQFQLDAYKYSSKMIKVPLELLQDTAFDLEAWLIERLAERLGRITNTHFTTGTGTGQPNGVVTASTLGKTTAGVAAVTSDEILDLIHSLDPAYRQSGTCRLMFNDTTLKAVLQLKDSQNRPLFQPSYRESAPATIHGYPFTINQDMASMATGVKFMLFGDFKYYIIRRVKALAMVRLSERYAEAYQVAFVGFMRTDADLANLLAVNHMKNA